MPMPMRPEALKGSQRGGGTARLLDEGEVERLIAQEAEEAEDDEKEEAEENT